MDVKQLFEGYPTMLTHTDLCSILNISKNSAYALLRNKEIEHMKLGCKYLIPKSCAIKYVERKLEEAR